MKELPGLCGLAMEDHYFKKVKNILFLAAEDRLINKSNQFYEEIKGTATCVEQEQIFFKGLLTAAGYNNFHNKFKELAQIFPYKTVRSLFKGYKKDSRTADFQ